MGLGKGPRLWPWTHAELAGSALVPRPFHNRVSRADVWRGTIFAAVDNGGRSRVRTR